MSLKPFFLRGEIPGYRHTQVAEIQQFIDTLLMKGETQHLSRYNPVVKGKRLVQVAHHYNPYGKREREYQHQYNPYSKRRQRVPGMQGPIIIWQAGKT